MSDAPSTRSADTSRKRILLVDDEAEVAALVVHLLGSNGFDARAISNPLDVVKQAAGFRPDLLILDFHLPKLLGPELALLLQRSPETRGIPIIFLSGMTDEDHRTIATISGGAAYLEKPVNEAKLLDTIRTILFES